MPPPLHSMWRAHPDAETNPSRSRSAQTAASLLSSSSNGRLAPFQNRSVLRRRLSLHESWAGGWLELQHAHPEAASAACMPHCRLPLACLLQPCSRCSDARHLMQTDLPLPCISIAREGCGCADAASRTDRSPAWCAWVGQGLHAVDEGLEPHAELNHKLEEPPRMAGDCESANALRRATMHFGSAGGVVALRAGCSIPSCRVLFACVLEAFLRSEPSVLRSQHAEHAGTVSPNVSLSLVFRSLKDLEGALQPYAKTAFVRNLQTTTLACCGSSQAKARTTGSLGHLSQPQASPLFPQSSPVLEAVADLAQGSLLAAAPRLYRAPTNRSCTNVRRQEGHAG